MRRALALAVVAAWLFQTPAKAALEITPLIPLGGAGVERGVVLIRCAGEKRRSLIVSRGAVLDVGLPDEPRDVVLTAAHGLPPAGAAVLRDCRVIGARGQPYGIAQVLRETGPDAAPLARDWAVLVVERRLDGTVGRLPAAHVTGDVVARLAARRAPVRLLLRQADPRQGDCNLRSLGPETSEPAEMLVYSCRGAPGVSGSPILGSFGGRMVVIGIHLGWGLEPVDGGPLRPTSIGQPVDAEVAAAISAAAVAADR